jgi:hypothetical protein
MRSWHLKPRAISRKIKTGEAGGFCMWSKVEPSDRRVCMVQRWPDRYCSRRVTCKSDFVICEQEQLRDAALSHQTHKLLGFIHSAAAGQTLQPLLRCATRCSSERSVWMLASRHEKHQCRGSDRQTKLRCQSGLCFIGLSAMQLRIN